MRKRHRIKSVYLHDKGVLLTTCKGSTIFFPFSKWGLHKIRIHAKHLLPTFSTLPVTKESLASLVGRYIYGREKEVVFRERNVTQIV